jgi:hypothetical protein
MAKITKKYSYWGILKVLSRSYSATTMGNGMMNKGTRQRFLGSMFYLIKEREGGK